LRRLVEWRIDSVALPPLGMGAGNLDAEESAQLMIPILIDHMRKEPAPRRVEVVVDSAYEHEVFGRVLAALPGASGAGGPAPAFEP
jgi:O-acetyl-ADP-ribose deacetylase (regulator of RNase III)